MAIQDDGYRCCGNCIFATSATAAGCIPAIKKPEVKATDETIVKQLRDRSPGLSSGFPGIMALVAGRTTAMAGSGERVDSTRLTRMLVPVAVGGVVLAVLAQRPALPSAAAPESLRVKVVRSFSHDPGAFTQGLAFHAGKLYESTGLVGQSSLRRVDPATGTVEAKVALGRSQFGEGLAVVGDRLVQLTWKEGRALLWSVAGLAPAGELQYAGEGWGLCFDGRQLVMSDGSDRLVRRDARTFEPVGAISVRGPAGPVLRLNELECVGDTIYANVWQTSRIARIDARTGDVTAWIEAAGLLTPEEARAANDLNGIAHLPASGRFIVTGKLWPRAFEVEFVPRRGVSGR